MSSGRRLIVLGSGFGGFSLLRRLRRGDWEATLVTPRNTRCISQRSRMRAPSGAAFSSAG